MQNGKGKESVMDRSFNAALGRAGEDAAAGMLESRGYIILDRNYMSPEGEIDIVAEKDGSIVFAEVKTRRGTMYGRPCEAVDGRKRSRIRKSAICYLREKRCGREGYGRIRFDVIEIAINHVKDAF